MTKPPSDSRPAIELAEAMAELQQKPSATKLTALMAALEHRGGRSLAELDKGNLWRAWSAAIGELRDPESSIRQQLDEPLARSSGLSPQGLRAGLDVVLGGMAGEAARELLRQGQLARDRRPVVVFIAANLPGLAVQTVLPALAVGRPVLIKSPTAEPHFGPALARCLARHQPALATAVAAMVWRGGDRDIEDPLLAEAGRVVAYGGSEAIADLRHRLGERLLAYGPKFSLGLVDLEDPAVDLGAVAQGLARDIALFDQRGCLSIQAVLVFGDPAPLAPLLAEALTEHAAILPPGPMAPSAAAAVQHLRSEADMRGLLRPEQPLAEGTVVVEDRFSLRPSPGLRTVRLYPIDNPNQLATELASRRGQLQGAALAGRRAWDWAPRLEGLGVSRCAPVGELQAADAAWYNGGISPVEALI